MKVDKFNVLIEVLQSASFSAKALTESEIAVNDGDVELCQKHNKEARALLATAKNDSFLEYFEEFCECDGVNGYDVPNNLELIHQCIILTTDISSLINLDAEGIEGSAIDNITKKLAVDINTVIEIYKAIYEN